MFFDEKSFTIPFDSIVNYYVGGFDDCYKSRPYSEMRKLIYQCDNNYFLLRDKQSNFLERLFIVFDDQSYKNVLQIRGAYIDVRGKECFKSLIDIFDDFRDSINEILEKAFQEYIDNGKK